jgi:hypothetical protein
LLLFDRQSSTTNPYARAVVQPAPIVADATIGNPTGVRMPSIKDRATQFESKAAATMDSDRRIQQGRSQTATGRASRVSTAGLQAAGFDTSSNPLLSQIWTEVQDFNNTWKHPSSMSTGEAQHRVAQLDSIMYWAGEYMTSKWAKDANTMPDAKRVKRWDALKDLLEKITQELQGLGVKALIGPTDWKQISNSKRSYWLERLDPRHRPGWVLSAVYEVWLSQRPTVAGNPVAFFDWLATPAGLQALVDKNVAGDAAKTVKYDAAYEPLWKKSVFFEGGLLKKTKNDHLFSTQGRRTEFSRDGWAIWVCSSALLPTNETPTRHVSKNHIFSYSHQAGEFHHSTFLSGSPVMAAGEWVVDNGKVKVITAKSGHYQPRPEDLLRFVTKFGDLPRDAIIRPDLLDRTTGPKKIHYYRVRDYVAMGTAARPITRNQFLQTIPGWANTDITEQHANASNGFTAQKLLDLLPTS